MTINLLDNRLGKMLDASIKLNDIDAWFHINSPRLQRKVIKQWIQDDQLMSKGVNADGEIIGLYSLATEIISEGRKPEGEPYNLFDEGDLYASMFIILLFDRIEIHADDNEIKGQDWYTERLFELTDENLDKYIEEAKIGLQEYTRRVHRIS